MINKDINFRKVVIALIWFLCIVVFVAIFTIALCRAAGRADEIEEVIKYHKDSN